MEKMGRLVTEQRKLVEKLGKMKDVQTATNGSTEAWRGIMEKGKKLLAGQPTEVVVTLAGQDKKTVSAFTFP